MDGAYTSLGNYADADLSKLVAAAAAALHLSEYDVIRWFGREALPLLARKYPALFERRTRPRRASALDVRDTGIGMTEEIQRRCLDAFFTTKG